MIIMVIVSTSLTLKKHKSLETEHAVEVLQTIVSTTENTLEKVWFDRIVRGAFNELNNEQTHAAILEILNLNEKSKEFLFTHPSQAFLQKAFQDYERHHKNIFLLDKNAVSLFSLSGTDLGIEHPIKAYYPQRVANVFQGETVFIPPIPLKRTLEVETGIMPTMFVALPVLDDENQVMAAFVVSLDPSQCMSTIVQNGRMGESGETYLFNENGLMLSQSRFGEQLIEHGLIETKETILKIDVRDPGFNILNTKSPNTQSKTWAFTQAVTQTLQKDESPYFKSYNDYRGIKVLGAWRWNEKLGIGIVSEIDEAEALSSFYTIQPFVVTVTVIGILSFIFFLLVLLRITNQSMKNIQESTHYLNAILVNSLDGIITINSRGIIKSYNKAAERLFEYQAEEVIGKNVNMLVPSPHKEQHDQYLNNYLESGIKKIIGSSRELEAKTKSGKSIYIQLGLAEAFHEGDRFFIASVHDMTDRKRAEDRLARKKRELKHLNMVLNEKLESNEKLMVVQSRQAALGEMISMIAHQWRQPLSAIAATALEMKMSIELDAEMLDEQASREVFLQSSLNSLNDIDFFVRNLTNTIDDFRNFYKPNKAAVEMDMTTIINKTLQIVQAAFESKDISFQTHFESNRTLAMYENEIIQVILNILKNAQDNFLEKKIENASIEIQTKDTEEGLEVDICDNGGGIPEHVLPNIFDPYFSTKEEKNGTGLGLYMSKIIIEDHHNGTLVAQNHNDGVCFRITLH